MSIEKAIERIKLARCQCDLSNCELAKETDAVLKILKEEAESPCERCVNWTRLMDSEVWACGLRCKWNKDHLNMFQSKETHEASSH